MPLKPSLIPESASYALQSGVASLAGAPEQPSVAIATALKASSNLVPVGAHQVYHLGLDPLRLGRGLDSASLVGWRTILLANDEPVAAAEASPTRSGGWSFAHANAGPFVEATVEAMRRAEGLPQVRKGTFEPRLIRVPALYVIALWLHSPQRDFFLPLPPGPKELTPYRAYTETEFMRKLRGLAKKVEVPAARGLQVPRQMGVSATEAVARHPFVQASAAKVEDLSAAKREWSARLLRPANLSDGPQIFTAAVSLEPDQNIVGVGVGEKITDGRPTGVGAVKFFVKVKFPESQLKGGGVTPLPKSIAGLAVDVEEVGIFRRFAKATRAHARRKPPATAGSLPEMPDPKVKLRPCQPGCSIGFQDPAARFVMAGTFGALVKDANGVYVLSNNHVLANENKLTPGSPIFQPGLLDTGNASTDQVAQLTRFIPLQVPVPNTVDCAVAALSQMPVATSDTLYIGAPKGVGAAQLDMIVHKFGRTTSYTVGRITSTDTDVAVNYDAGRLVFQRQILVVGVDGTAFSNAGDSGSLIMERATNAAIGLLFAGSSTHTIANHIEDVLNALAVTLA